MSKYVKNFLDQAFAYLIILPAFYLIVYYGALHEKVKELYFIVFRIPYYKGNGKFHPYVVRTDR